MEPLLPPLRHPEFCFGGRKGRGKYKLDMNYVIHDFESFCSSKIQKHSRTVFVDMGAALDFHIQKERQEVSPAIYITHTYGKFGIQFDHIYAYEIKPKDPAEVYQQIPDDLKSSYHWYNVGVDSNITSSNNPLKLIMENFNKDDFIVVKLGKFLHLLMGTVVVVVVVDDDVFDNDCDDGFY
jgi:hypothetical protein